MSERQEGKGKFMGFPIPEENYSKLPHVFIEQLPTIDSMAELKVVIYLLRHTWGFSEFGKPKRITTDEFMNGRKKSDGSRMDAGTGLAKGSVITGLESAVEHGFILVEVDDSDKARIEKSYSLNMSDVQDLNTDVQDLDNRGSKVVQRSEKETKERKLTASGYQKFSQKSTDELKEMMKLGERMEALIGLTPDFKNTKWTKALRDIVHKEAAGQKFDTYAKWLNSGNEYNRPKPYQIASNPKLILTTWGQAFIGAAKKEAEYVPEPDWMNESRRRAERQNA